MTRKGVLPALLISLGLSGCLTVGANFPSENFSWIVKNKTTRADAQRLLGEPFRVGVDAGQNTWTYGYYRYRLFGPTYTKDLVLYFNKDGTVSSYTFNTGFPGEKQQWLDRNHP
jgi:outer membrane protein assembly factor BamE (lipoprotein component of BamABCDE complex)